MNYYKKSLKYLSYYSFLKLHECSIYLSFVKPININPATYRRRSISLEYGIFAISQSFIEMQNFQKLDELATPSAYNTTPTTYNTTLNQLGAMVNEGINGKLRICYGSANPDLGRQIIE